MSNWTEDDHMTPEQEREAWENEQAARDAQVREDSLFALIPRLRERTKLAYGADCKCGKCQIVDSEDLALAIVFLRLHQAGIGMEATKE